MARKAPELHEVEITGKNFSKFKKPVVYVDAALKGEFEKKGKDGTTRMQRLAGATALRGFKHLYEKTIVAGKCKRLILTQSATRMVGSDLYVSVDDYSKAGQTTFLGLYRDAGLSVAQGYLSSVLPANFPAPPKGLSTEEARKATNHISDVIAQSGVSAQGLGKVAKATRRALRKAKAEKLGLRKELEEVRSLLKTSKLSVYAQDLEELKDRLTKKYGETSGRGNWQAWFPEHSWVLGPNYLTPIEKARVGLTNVPDFLLPTLDGFADILELKLPGHEVVKKDPSHPGSYFWSSEAAKAIGQASNYIQEAEDHRRELKEKIEEAIGTELSIVRPRAFVIIGDDEEWDAPTKRAFRNLRSTLHGIEVLTYSDIVRRASALIRLLEDTDEES